MRKEHVAGLLLPYRGAEHINALLAYLEAQTVNLELRLRTCKSWDEYLTINGQLSGWQQCISEIKRLLTVQEE